MTTPAPRRGTHAHAAPAYPSCRRRHYPATRPRIATKPTPLIAEARRRAARIKPGPRPSTPSLSACPEYRADSVSSGRGRCYSGLTPDPSTPGPGLRLSGPAAARVGGPTGSLPELAPRRHPCRPPVFLTGGVHAAAGCRPSLGGGRPTTRGPVDRSGYALDQSAP